MLCCSVIVFILLNIIQAQPVYKPVYKLWPLHKRPLFFSLESMPVFKEHTPEQLYEPIVEVLERAPGGLSEHELLHALTERGFLGFNPALLCEELSLFQTHFFLFHVLYRLQEVLREQQRYELAIFCLEIRLWPYRSLNAKIDELVEADPLREYYLNLDNLNGTDAAEVRRMLEGFYLRLEAYEQRSKAYHILGLDESSGLAAVRRRYRSLVKKYHPDHGGDREKFQEVEQAMQLLSRLY